MLCRQIVGVNQVVRILELIEHIGRSAVGSGVVVELLLEDKQVVRACGDGDASRSAVDMQRLLCRWPLAYLWRHLLYRQ